MNHRAEERRTLGDPEQHEYQVIYDVRDESSLVVFSQCRNRKCVLLHIIHTYRQYVSPLDRQTILLPLFSQQDLMAASEQ